MFPLSRVSSLAAATAIALMGTSSLAAASVVPHSSSPAVAARPDTVASVAYAYWGFYRWDPATSTWPYMKVGANDPSTSASKDGSVYGFRWALVVKDPRVPRAAGSFQQICASTPKAAGKKRIGFVIDYGTAADAPNGDEAPAPQGLCASVDPSATVQQALLSVTEVRIGSSGLICGIHGYPSSGCGATVKGATEPPPDTKVTLTVPGSATPTTAPSSAPTKGQQSPGASSGTASTDSGDSNNQVVLIVVGVVVILVLVGGALVVRRRGA